MVNSMDLGRGFLKLQEDNNSRRSSSLFRHKPLELNENGIHYVTRINCGCGQCVPFRVKVEKDDGGLRIGKLTLATNCHLIIVIFGFFFLIAGSVLTALAYKTPHDDETPEGGGGDPDLSLHERASTEQVDSPSRQEGKVAGPIFIIFGSTLILLGFTLTALACKLNREAKRQLHLNRFTWETPPLQTPDIYNVSAGTPNHFQPGENGNSLDTFSVRSRELSTGSGNSGGRRDSSFTFSRQNQPPPLSTITQAVPVGIFLFGGGGPDSTTSPKSPSIQVTDPSGFQEIELSSPTTESAPASASVYSRRHGNIPPDAYKKYRSHSASDGSCNPPPDTSRPYLSNRNLNPVNAKDSTAATSEGTTGHSKVNLGLRPSLPIIPMFAPASASPHYFSRVVTPLDARNLYVSSRSDEPFGSIASLSTSGDIACFPITQSSTAPPSNDEGKVMEPTLECDEELSTSPPVQSNESGCGANIANNNDINERNLRTGIVSVSNDRMDYQRNDVNLNNTSNNRDEDVIAAATNDPRNTSSIISELPPIMNVNECGSKVSRSGVGADKKSGTSVLSDKAANDAPTPNIPFQSNLQSEDWQDENSIKE